MVYGARCLFRLEGLRQDGSGVGRMNFLAADPECDLCRGSGKQTERVGNLSFSKGALCPCVVSVPLDPPKIEDLAERARAFERITRALEADRENADELRRLRLLKSDPWVPVSDWEGDPGEYLCKVRGSKGDVERALVRLAGDRWECHESVTHVHRIGPIPS